MSEEREPREPRTSISAEEFAAMIDRIKIRHIEEIERRTGVALDEVMAMPGVGLKAHAIAYVVAVDEDGDATWDAVGDGPILKLDEDGEAPTPGEPEPSSPDTTPSG